MKLPKREIIIVVVICLILIVSGITLMRKLNAGFTDHEQILDDGWSISLYGVQYENAVLSQFELPHIHADSRVVLEHTLKQQPYQQAALRVQTRYSVIQVYLNDELIYSNGEPEYEQNHVLGNGYHWIALPQNYAGEKLSIVYLTGEDQAFTSFDEVYIMDSLESYHSLFGEDLFTGIIACCLIATGLICIMCAVITMGRKGHRSMMLLWLGMFSVFVSVWMLCNSKLMELVTRDLTLICHMEYISMYLASISMLMFVAAFFQGKKEKQLATLFAGGFTILGVILTLMSVTNVRHFPKTVLAFQVTAMLLSFYIIVILIREVRRQKKAEKVFLIGIGCFFVCTMLELLRYRYNKLCVPADALKQSVIPFGALIFILAMLGSYFCRILERVAEEMERKTLYEMAYQDALTNIKNRAWCEKVMHDYEADCKPVTIINMDLNKFKSVNDQYGHAVGDELLIRFAALLGSIFYQNSCVGRMGGDEFIVIMDYLPDEMIEEHMQRLLRKIDEENRKGYRYQISLSYGYASIESGSGMTPWKLYEEADRRMYEYKQRAHEA